MRKGWLLLILPCILLVVLIDQPFFQRDDSNQASSGAINFDSWSTGIDTVLFNTDGSIEYTLEAARQVHYINDSTVLEQPYIRLYQPSGEHWNIVADSGKIHPAPADTLESGEAAFAKDFGAIDLIDNVELYQNDDSGNRIVLSTAFLTVDPQTETLMTDQPVRLQSSTVHQTAIGMRANLDDNTVTFLSQIRGSYDTSAQQ